MGVGFLSKIHKLGVVIIKWEVEKNRQKRAKISKNWAFLAKKALFYKKKFALRASFTIWEGHYKWKLLGKNGKNGNDPPYY